MTDHKFTDDDVIKALRELQEMSEITPPICHYEKDITEPPFCKPFEQFQNDAKVALEVINRQKAEIEEKSKNITFAAKELIRLDRERSEVIKEFAERLKSDLGRIPQHQFTRSQVEWSINTFVKEMTEGNHESQST